ncbi:hypothetical protein [Psychromarinibacter halotolerans]|uniref:Uncharacterized protein n=1 Tax=Psychromarinibacter halotolerans TaxID=1775175 RepID=A0ABV7GX94_9RHOB|nr:hypothetical protein [Psychromarinibacter halotolerans]MDF0598263.1 hypothetical protein [Psychromarinibacter halotolerans]
MTDQKPLSPSEAHGLRYAQELEGHLGWLDSFTSAALAVLAVASGIYTYLGVSSLLDDSGALSFFAAMSYSVAVSVGIFVFWSYMMRLLPAVRTAAARTGLFVSMGLGCCAIVAMSSWLNAAALAGAAAVEQHLANTVQQYQTSLERAHSVAVSAQGLERDVARVRQSFQDLSEQEASGQLSGLAGRGAVFRVLRQKSEELAALEQQIQAQAPLVEQAFAEGNAILSRMRALTVEPGPVEQRSVSFSEEAVRLAGVITTLRQLSVAPLVVRSADDLAASVVLPEVEEIRDEQSTTIASVLNVLSQRAETLKMAAEAVLAMPAPADITYTPVSTADAVILYAGNFVPSWAGAISIDLLPAVLVFILMVTQAAIRQGRGRAGVEDTLTLAEFRAALGAVREVELALDRTNRAESAAPAAAVARAEAPRPDAPLPEPSAPDAAPDPKVQRFKAAGDE